MVPIELLLAAQSQNAALLEQSAALTAQLTASQAEAREDRAKLQLTIDSLVAKLDAVMAKKTKGKLSAPTLPTTAWSTEPEPAAVVTDSSPALTELPNSVPPQG